MPALNSLASVSLRSLSACIACGLWIGCAEPALPPDAGALAVRVEPLAVATEVEAAALPLDALRALEDAWAERAAPSAEGIVAARRAASLARVRSWREASSDGLERARTLLHEASVRRALPGACEAALELARLEARDALEPGAGYLVAYRTARRFGEERDAACATEARRMLGALDGFRADRALLAAIDADPDAEDPSVGLAGDPVPGSREPGDESQAWAAQRAAGGEPATIESITVYGREDPRAQGVRVVLALDRVATFERLDLAAEGALPRRLALDLAGAVAAPALAAAIPVGAGGLARVRQARHDSGTRVVLDLEPGAEPRVFILPEPFRIVIDVLRASEVEPLATTGAREIELLLIDPGHGGNDYGARAFGLRESDITLDLAMRVRAELRRRLPAVRAVLTRETDTFITLEQRAAMANAIDADAFISIHLNAAWEAVDHGGVTTFVLDTTNDRQALRLAARENGTSVAEIGDLQRILAGLRRGDQLDASRALAERIHRGTLAGGRTVIPALHDRGVRSAMFYVLVGATMPAVLVEASFLTFDDEARALRTDAYKQAIADGIVEGIVRWVEGR